MKDLKWHYLSIYYDRRNWNILLENIFKFRQKTEEKYSCFLIFFSEEKGANIKLAITVPDTNSEFINQTYNYFDEFVFKNLSIRKNEFPYGKSLWANYDNNVVVRDIYRLYYFTKDEIEYVNYISPQINRAVKNKSYFYNCYGKEEKFYIENQG